MADRMYDLVIVGGGVAGGAMGAVMARTGRSVLVLEQSAGFADRVRGEWIAPWGVLETRRLGLYDALMAAGGHHLARHVTYDESLAPATAEAGAQDLSAFAPDVPGPLCIRHPLHCQTLFDAAGAAGATTLRPVTVERITPGATPGVTFTHDGVTRTVAAGLVVGADGRMSMVRDAAGVRLRQDPPHHWFAGLLVNGADDWSDDLQATGAADNFCFLAFPQGRGRVRVYGGYALGERGRFTGPGGPRRFLDAFRMPCAPANEALARGAPAGPLLSYFNNDSWTDTPFAPGCVLVGDAAGWNDPIIGLGLSITYRDVRIVSEILQETPAGGAPDFRAYAQERAERMRRLRFAASLNATLDMEFDAAARRRRARFHERARSDPTIRSLGAAVLSGPEALPPDCFTPAFRAHVLDG